jgi:hypothetical protein
MNNGTLSTRLRKGLAASAMTLCLTAAAFSAAPAEARITYNDGAYAEVGGGCQNPLGLNFLGVVTGAPGSYYQVWVYVWDKKAWSSTSWYESGTALTTSFNYHGWLYMYAEVARPNGAGGWSFAGEPFPTTVQDGQYLSGSWCYLE